jgi:glycosyltransferase involved in cell wall biosynthesis
MKLSIVIPIYNEQSTLSEILKAVAEAPLPDEITQKEIILVDDGSKDGTRDILKGLEVKYKVIYHEKNKGKGGALSTGFKVATGDIVLIQDADLEYDPNEYAKLLEPIVQGKADVVYGSRFAGGMPHRVLYFWHMFANKILTLLSNMFSDLNLTDMETCYKVFKKEVLDRFEIEENRFGFEPEITAKVGTLARSEGIRVYEIGISYYGRTYEEGKKIGLKDAFRAFWCIFKYNTSRFAHFVKYGFNGLLVAFSQFATLFLLIEVLGFKSIILENIANAISIEVSIITGFLIHSQSTWRYKFNSLGNFVGKGTLFHLTTLISFAIRVLLFYILSLCGMHYISNTIIGILISISLNFFCYDNFVFKLRKTK